MVGLISKRFWKIKPVQDMKLLSPCKNMSNICQCLSILVPSRLSSVSLIVNFFMNHTGRVQKKSIMENSIQSPDPPPPPVMEKKILFFFLKLDHFLRTFCKKCSFTIENPKKTFFSKKDKTGFRQANFCLLRCQILL